jgi:putative Mg2+ transporter-C (MgtC) family protein
MTGNAEFVLRLGVSAVLGSLIGLDRERLRWAAGLRTHMLVCVGACLVMIVSAFGFSDVLGDHIVLDPSRVAAQVVSGVGFLGAGSIILRNEVVKGLTTAASLWTVAAIGLAVGAGLYLPAIAGTAIILIILVGLKPIEDHYRRSRRPVEITMSADKGAISLGALEQALGWKADRITRLVISPTDDAERERVSIGLGRLPARYADQVVSELKQIPGAADVQRADRPR